MKLKKLIILLNVFFRVSFAASFDAIAYNKKTLENIDQVVPFLTTQ